MPNQGAWKNTPTGSGKVTIPAGYHNGSGYVDTATVYTNAYNAGVTAADARVNTSSASYIEGVRATKESIEPTLINKTGSSWNNTGTLQTVVPANNYFIVDVSCLRTDYESSSPIITETSSHTLNTVYYASIDTTVTYSVYTERTKASISMAVIYWN